MNTDLSSLARTLAERACREILAEVHFGSERTGLCSATNPENAKFLDRRAAELAPTIEAVIREAIDKTLDAAILAVEGERVEEVGAGDDSYNLALEHSTHAIRSLKPVAIQKS